MTSADRQQRLTADTEMAADWQEQAGNEVRRAVRPLPALKDNRTRDEDIPSSRSSQLN